MNEQNIELKMCLEYLQRSEDECSFEKWIESCDFQFSLVLAEGFEERSLGILEKLSKAHAPLERIIVGRYSSESENNKKYRKRFEKLAASLTPKRWDIVNNNNDGLWVRESINTLNTECILLDVTGISNRGLFGALDAAALSNRKIFIGYSEAGEYWPKEGDWKKLKKDLDGNESLAEIVDTMPWLFGYEHKVELVPGHEGFDSAGSGKALLAFLPFKCARLGAILSQENYTEITFIAGLPRLEANSWRLRALKEINEPLIKDWPVKDVSTFSYRNTISVLAPLLFSEKLLKTNDVHLAILGSKLQTIGCWALSTILKPITVVTSVPIRYYPEAFSDNIGASWVFRLNSPY